MRIWQTTELDYAIAEEFFGWRWLAFVGVPVRDAPGYPEQCKVRQFFSPECAMDANYWAHTSGHEPATGDEPLSYRYCSSHGPECVPHFSGDAREIAHLEHELKQLDKWPKYRECLAAQIGSSDDADLALADCEAKCIAALAAIGSKYVTEVKPCG